MNPNKYSFLIQGQDFSPWIENIQNYMFHKYENILYNNNSHFSSGVVEPYHEPPLYSNSTIYDFTYAD